MCQFFSFRFRSFLALLFLSFFTFLSTGVSQEAIAQPPIQFNGIVRYVDSQDHPQYGWLTYDQGEITVQATDIDGTLPIQEVVSRVTAKKINIDSNSISWSDLVDQKRVLNPVYQPKHAIFVGLNYPEHAEQSGMKVPSTPVLFEKADGALTDPYADILYPVRLKRLLDYEVELGVVMKNEVPLGGEMANEAEALSHIFGYVLVNDYGFRDLQLSEGQWWKGKSIDRGTPVGPWILLPDTLTGMNIASLWDQFELQLAVMKKGHRDFDVRQQAFASQAIHRLDTIINSISETIILEPGDLISTGTPAGCAMRVNPLMKGLAQLFVFNAQQRTHLFIETQQKTLENENQRLYLLPGDQVKARISLLGEQENAIKQR